MFYNTTIKKISISKTISSNNYLKEIKCFYELVLESSFFVVAIVWESNITFLKANLRDSIYYLDDYCCLYEINYENHLYF